MASPESARSLRNQEVFFSFGNNNWMVGLACVLMNYFQASDCLENSTPSCRAEKGLALPSNPSGSSPAPTRLRGTAERAALAGCGFQDSVGSVERTLGLCLLAEQRRAAPSTVASLGSPICQNRGPDLASVCLIVCQEHTVQYCK